MIIDQLFEDDDKKKKLNEIDPRNYDSDEDYYNDLYGEEDDEEDFDADADDEDFSDEEPESHYEKYVRVNNLESRLNELEVGQATGVAAQNDNKPRQTYSVKIVGQFTGPGKNIQALQVWQALETILPRDYPRVPFQQQSGNEPQARVCNDINEDGFSIVKQGINSLDIAETIAGKFESKGIPAEVIDGGLYEEGSMEPMPEFYAGQEITWRPKFAKMVPVPVTVVAAAPGKLKIKLQSPRMIQNYGKDTIVVNVADSDIMPKQGVAEAKAATASFRAGNKKRAELNAMSDEERRAYDKEQQEKQRKKDDARLERERQKLAAKKGVNESRKLNEAMLLEDPVYRKFKTVGRYIAERKMTEKEILDVFAAAEKGMTNKDTGANRTMLGRGKDATTKFAGNVSDAVKGVLNSMRTSVPVEAVEVAYNEATNALANVAGGQKGAVMQAIKKYRMLSKQYPKTAALARSALIMIAGMASSGVAPLAIIGAVGTLDRALKGNTLFNSLVGGAGDTALAGVSQAVAGAFAPDATSTQPGDADFQLPADSVAANAQVQLDAAREWINADAATRAEIEQITGMSAAQLQDIAVSNDLISNADSLAPGEEIVPPGGEASVPGAEGFGGGTYTTVAGDEGGRIAQAMGIPFKELEGLNPQITNWNKLPIGTELQLPPTGDNVGSVWRDLSAAPGVSTPTAPTTAAPSVPAETPSVAPTTAAAPASPYGAVRGPMGLDYTSIAGIPVVPGQPLNPTQMAVADFAMQQGNKLSPVVQAAYDLAKRGAVRESIKFKKLSVDKLIDQKTTVLSWALSESVGRKSQSVNLTTVGTYTVFENVDRYRRALLEYADPATGPGRPQLPDYYRPDMPDAPVTPTEKPGMIGRGLNWLDKAAGKVGGALSNFGHQFTTNVTKEKLKMNWHQAGKPTDSDQLAAWLVKQGVPQDVVSSVYSSMGIPYTAAPAAPAEPAAATGGAQKQMAFYGTNPATGKPWTVDELQAKARAGKTAPTADAEPSTTQPATTKPATSPAGFNAGNVMNLPGMEKYGKKPAPAKTPNFAGPSGYSSVTTSFKPTTKPTAPTTAALPAGGGAGVKAAAPVGTRVVSGGPTPDEQAKLAQRIAQAAQKPVAEMLNMVETKEDVQRIKQFIDQTFVKYGAVSESAFVVRNKLIEHVTQVGAQRRREYARKS